MTETKVTKKIIASAIFTDSLSERAKGVFTSNRQFRVHLIKLLQEKAGVSSSGAAALYNQCRIEAMAADPKLVFGRDSKPKVARVQKRKRANSPADAV